MDRVLKQLRIHALREFERAKYLVAAAKSKGLAAEEMAWTHTLLAYDDILKQIDKIDKLL
jgi:hypothetical protein